MDTAGMERDPMKTYVAPPPRRPLRLPARLVRRKPRSYFEWAALRRWGSLPPWEETPAGYLLRSAREDAGVSQRELGKRLGCSQQAIAQAERWGNNPTVRFLREWAQALERWLELSFD